MSKARVILCWIFTAAFLAVVVGITRTWVPDWSYLNHDVALGIAGFWIYWLGNIAIAFSLVIAFLLVYLILLVKEQPDKMMDSIQTFWREYEKIVKRKQARKTHAHTKKEKPPAAQPDEEPEKEEPEAPDAWQTEEFE